MWKSWQCDNCRKGLPCNHTADTGTAYLEDENGVRKWFCSPICIYVKMSEKEFKKYYSKQIDIEGHYESLKRMVNDRKKNKKGATA